MLAAKAQENTFFPSVLTEEAEWLSSQQGAHASGWAVYRMSLEWTRGQGGECRRAGGCWLGQATVNP